MLSLLYSFLCFRVVLYVSAYKYSVFGIQVAQKCKKMLKRRLFPPYLLCFSVKSSTFAR